MKIIELNELNSYEIIKKKNKTNRDIRLYFLKDISLVGYSNHYPDILFKELNKEISILPIKEMCMSLQKKSYYEENGMKYEYCDQPSVNYNIITSDVYFFIYNTENYYHFIYDTLPYLYCFLKLRKQNKNIKLLMNYNKNKNNLLPFVKESLELLNITKNDIIIHKSNNIYKNLYCSNSLTHDGLSNQPPRKEIFEIYEKMTTNALQQSFKYKNISFNKIYISRRTWINNNVTDNIGTNYTTRRKLMNEDDLVNKLKEDNFIEIFGENYSMTEKILLFYNAKVIIGAIGGTIANCVFANKETKIITIVSPEFLKINYRMKFLFNDNVTLFEDTYLDCKKGEIPPNVRIEVTDKDSIYFKNIGEIVQKKDDGYTIKLGKNFIGFNQNEQYETIILKKTQFKQLDNGINSPYRINIKTLLDNLN